jgi:hypothetical protein
MRYTGRRHRFFDYRLDGQNMLATGYFRKNPTKTTMDFNLRGNGIAEYLTTIADDGGCGFVATGFNGKNTGHDRFSIRYGYHPSVNL